MSDNTNTGRTRINMSQSAKGNWQLDIAAEYATPEESAKNLADAIDRAQKLAAEKGLPLASA